MTITNSSTHVMVSKWGKNIVETGFTQVPNHLIAINQFLPKEEKLSPTEFLVLLQLLLSWWSADRFPFPSKATLSERTALSTRQVQRALASLEKRNFITRDTRRTESRGRGSNLYNLSGVVALLQKVVEQHPNAFRSKRITAKTKEPRPVQLGVPSSTD